MYTSVRMVLTGLFGLLLAGPLLAEEDDLDTQLMRATVKIGHDKSTGTGFILTRPDPGDPRRKQYLLVTAAHVFSKMTSDEATLYFRKKEADGVFKKEPQKVTIRKDGKPRWTKHPSEDVAVLIIVPPRAADIPDLPVDLLATNEAIKRWKVRPGDNVACLGYPHRVEANQAGFAILRKGPIASYPLTPTKTNRTFFLSTNTFEGDSGGPVYLADSNRAIPGTKKREEVRLILGMVTAQQVLDEESRMIYGTTKVRHRLGLAIVLHATFILETIKQIP